MKENKVIAKKIISAALAAMTVVSSLGIQSFALADIYTAEDPEDDVISWVIIGDDDVKPDVSAYSGIVMGDDGFKPDISAGSGYGYQTNATYTVNSSDGVNVRTGAGTSYSRVGAARNGISFTVSKVDGAWGYTGSIQCTNGYQSGWVCLDYCTLTSSSSGSPSSTSSSSSSSSSTEAKYKVNSSNGVSVRTGAGTGYSRVGAASNGITFTVSKTSGSWGYTGAIQCTNGWQSGWVCLDYCTYLSGSTSSSQNTSSSSDSSVYLNIPSYKQSDSRWGSTKMPGSNYTISSVGCTLTSLSMVYSYNHNKTVYPNELMNSLKFTTYGAVYWQGVYDLGFTRESFNESAINQSIMSKIYDKLKSGKPVIIGCNNSSGDEHWVVITGYSGNTSNFSASGFTINDPGPNRSTLQDLLNYVNRVKYIVY